MPLTWQNKPLASKNKREVCHFQLHSYLQFLQRISANFNIMEFMVFYKNNWKLITKLACVNMLCVYKLIKYMWKIRKQRISSSPNESICWKGFIHCLDFVHLRKRYIYYAFFKCLTGKFTVIVILQDMENVVKMTNLNHYHQSSQRQRLSKIRHIRERAACELLFILTSIDQ